MADPYDDSPVVYVNIPCPPPPNYDTVPSHHTRLPRDKERSHIQPSSVPATSNSLCNIPGTPGALQPSASLSVPVPSSSTSPQGLPTTGIIPLDLSNKIQHAKGNLLVTSGGSYGVDKDTVGRKTCLGEAIESSQLSARHMGKRQSRAVPGERRQLPPTTVGNVALTKFRPEDILIGIYSTYPLWTMVVKKCSWKGRQGVYKDELKTVSGKRKVFYWVEFSPQRVGAWIQEDRLVRYHPSFEKYLRLGKTEELFHEMKLSLDFARDNFGEKYPQGGRQPDIFESDRFFVMLRYARSNGVEEGDVAACEISQLSKSEGDLCTTKAEESNLGNKMSMKRELKVETKDLKNGYSKNEERRPKKLKTLETFTISPDQKLFRGASRAVRRLESGRRQANSRSIPAASTAHKSVCIGRVANSKATPHVTMAQISPNNSGPHTGGSTEASVRRFEAEDISAFMGVKPCIQGLLHNPLPQTSTERVHELHRVLEKSEKDTDLSKAEFRRCSAILEDAVKSSSYSSENIAELQTINVEVQQDWLAKKNDLCTIRTFLDVNANAVRIALEQTEKAQKTLGTVQELLTARSESLASSKISFLEALQGMEQETVAVARAQQYLDAKSESIQKAFVELKEGQDQTKHGFATAQDILRVQSKAIQMNREMILQGKKEFEKILLRFGGFLK